MGNTDNTKDAEIKKVEASSQASTTQQQPNSASEPQPASIKCNLNANEMAHMILAAEDVDFVLDSKAAILSTSTPYATKTLLIITSLLLFGIIWAMVTKIDEFTVGFGKVVPSSQVQAIQNLEGGIVAKIFVTEGKLVKKGEVLVKLDDAMFASQYHAGYAKWLALQATIARLKAQTDNKSEIVFPPEVLKAPELVAQGKDLFITQQTSFKENLENLQHTYKLVLDELQIVTPLVEKGVISRVELLRLKREVIGIKTKIDGYENNIREQALNDLTNAQKESNEITESLAGLLDRMQRTTMVSPVNGIVNEIFFNTIGGVLKPGMPIMDIVPLHDQLMIEARVSPTDIGFLSVGQKARVKITAYDYAVYGDLAAVVTNVGASTNVDEKGNNYYQVTLKTDKNYLGKKEGVFPIIPGMIAMVDIMTGKKSMMTYIMKPIMRAKERALRER